MDERKQDIIGQTIELFLKHGIRSLSMSEISGLQHISKKTLYAYFKDKNDLVCQCVTHELDRFSSHMEEITSKALNAIDESYMISEIVINQVSSMHPAKFIELKSFYPEAYKLFEEHQEECISKSVKENLEKGVKEGLYRADLNIHFITNLYLMTIVYLFTTDLIDTNKYSFSELYLEFFNYHIRGISSEKGQNYLKTKYHRND